MEWTRIDDIDENSNIRVRYCLVTPPGYSFEIRATRLGVQLTGITPYYTDYVPIQEKLSWAQYQSQRIRETGTVIIQTYLDRGEI